MSKTINVIVTRQANPMAEPYKEAFQVDADEHACVLDVLEAIGGQIEEKMKAYMMANGGPGPDMPRPLIYPHSCKVRKCGACSMIINGVPGLACGTFIDELEGDAIIVEPLSKFPVLCDLTVDKAAFDQMLESVEVWQHDVPQHDEETYLERFESARCINCGCCMEVCDKYVPGGAFAGPAAITNVPRIVDELHDGKIREEYAQICRKHVADPCECTQEVTCADVCPMELPFTTMLARLKSL